MTQERLFAPYDLGGTLLPNRVVMAPMTRSRATPPGNVPNALMAEYYAQRASAGLIVSEGTPVSPRAHGYPYTPGLHSTAQIEGWKQVTAAVHRGGGRIFTQLWHCGRIGHHSVHADGSPPAGPSTIAAASKVFAIDAHTGEAYLTACEAPRAMTTEEARNVIDEFVAAARNAIDAGFDGIEIHGANGYLFDQFRCPYLNDRQDEFGGSLEARSRLLLQTAAAVAATIGAQRVGVRLAPLGAANDMRPDPDPLGTYGYIARELERLGIGYLHINDQSGAWIHDPANELVRCLRAAFPRTLIACGGFDGERAAAALDAGNADLIAFGKPFISNPDLVERLRAGAPLAGYDLKTFYTRGARGYTDYPRCDGNAAQQSESA